MAACDPAPAPRGGVVGGDERACPSLSTKAHPSRWTGRMRPALTLAPTLENGLQSLQNRPCVRPAAPLGCPLYTAPSVAHVLRYRPAPTGDPGLGDTIPYL